MPFYFGLEQVAVDPVAADMPISEYLSRFYSGRIVNVGECATHAVLVRAEQSPTGREDHCSAYTINSVIRHASMNVSLDSMMCCVPTAIVNAGALDRIARERGTGGTCGRGGTCGGSAHNGESWLHTTFLASHLYTCLPDRRNPAEMAKFTAPE